MPSRSQFLDTRQTSSVGIVEADHGSGPTIANEELAASLRPAPCHHEFLNTSSACQVAASALVMRLTPDLGFWADAGPRPEDGGGDVLAVPFQKVEAGHHVPESEVEDNFDPQNIVMDIRGAETLRHSQEIIRRTILFFALARRYRRKKAAGKRWTGSGNASPNPCSPQISLAVTDWGSRAGQRELANQQRPLPNSDSPCSPTVPCLRVLTVRFQFSSTHRCRCRVGRVCREPPAPNRRCTLPFFPHSLQVCLPSPSFKTTGPALPVAHFPPVVGICFCFATSTIAPTVPTCDIHPMVDASVTTITGA
jgi:hypothetical protein